MLNLNQTIQEQVVSEALAKTESNPRWHRATQRAAKELSENPYLEEMDGGLLIKSSSSDNIYTTDNECECAAWSYHKPCWHRALSRLVSRIREHENKVIEMPAPKVQTLVGSYVLAVVPSGFDNGGCVIWKGIEGFVSMVEHRKYHSVITLRSGERFSSDYLVKTEMEARKAA